MRVNNKSLRCLVVLCIFIIIPVSCLSSGDGSGGLNSGNSGGSDSGSQTDGCGSIPVSVAVLPWPPYAGNVSNDWRSRVIEQLRNDISHTLDMNISFLKPSSEGELKKLFKANKIDIGFPLIKQHGDDFGDANELIRGHPGLDYLIVPQNPSAGEVCMNALLYSWPLLALSIIFTGMAGILIWLLEAIGNREEFPKSFARGTWEGFWWAFISMTTVGYGDKCPRSIAGRCFAVIWIFAGLILVAVFMANVTTALTSVSAKPEYKLSEAQVGVVSKSLEEEFARNRSADVEEFDNYHELMKALRQRRVQGILIDNYTARVHLLNETKDFLQQIILRKHFPLEENYDVILVVNKLFCREKKMSWADDCCLKRVYNHIIHVTTKQFWDIGETQVFKRINHKYSARMATHSFNLFEEYKEGLKEATYISLGILAGLIIAGLMADKIFGKSRSQTTEDHELKVDEFSEILQDIAKGKEILKGLQLLHQQLEEKINDLNSDWKRNSTDEKQLKNA